MTDLLPRLLLVTGTFILAGLVKGVSGFGLPTVAMGLLGLAMPPVEAAALLLVPSFVTNVWQLLAGPRFGALLRRLWGMMLGIVAGTLAGSGLIASTAGHAATAALGGALALYGVVGLLKPRLRVPAAAEPWVGPLVGAATGLVTGSDGRFRCPCRPLSRLSRTGAGRPRSGAWSVLHHFHAGTRRRLGLAWRIAHGSRGCLVACPRAGDHGHGAGRVSPRTAAARNLPPVLLRRPVGAGGRTPLAGPVMTGSDIIGVGMNGRQMPEPSCTVTCGGPVYFASQFSPARSFVIRVFSFARGRASSGDCLFPPPP